MSKPREGVKSKKKVSKIYGANAQKTKELG